MRLKATAWIPAERPLAEAVQHNANGDVCIISVENEVGQTVQMVVTGVNGQMEVRIRGWGNKPELLGNLDRTQLNFIIPYENPTTLFDFPTK